MARCRGASPSPRRQFKEVGDRASGSLWATGPMSYVCHGRRGVGNDDLLRPLPLRRGCPLHWADGPAVFTGGLTISQARATQRRGQLVTTDGELRRPTSSRCTDEDATTTAPIPRVPKSPFRLAAGLRVPVLRIAQQYWTVTGLGREAPRRPQRRLSLRGRRRRSERPRPRAVPRSSRSSAPATQSMRCSQPTRTFPRAGGRGQWFRGCGSAGSIPPPRQSALVE